MPRGPVTRAERLTDRAKISWVIVAVGEAAWSESPPARRGGVPHRPAEARKELSTVHVRGESLRTHHFGA
jgi:hypothetical protein